MFSGSLVYLKMFWDIILNVLLELGKKNNLDVFFEVISGKGGLIFQLSSIIKYLYLHKMDIFNLSLHLYKKVLPTTIYENNLCKIHLFNFL